MCATISGLCAKSETKPRSDPGPGPWLPTKPDLILHILGTENPLQSNLGNPQQIQVKSQSTLEAMMVTMQLSMMELMSFMNTTMQTLVQNQNMVLQLLAGKQSK